MVYSEFVVDVQFGFNFWEVMYVFIFFQVDDFVVCYLFYDFDVFCVLLVVEVGDNDDDFMVEVLG